MEAFVVASVEAFLKTFSEKWRLLWGFYKDFN
jgi:hypothetical protein